MRRMRFLPQHQSPAIIRRHENLVQIEPILEPISSLLDHPAPCLGKLMSLRDITGKTETP